MDGEVSTPGPVGDAAISLERVADITGRILLEVRAAVRGGELYSEDGSVTLQELNSWRRRECPFKQEIVDRLRRGNLP